MIIAVLIVANHFSSPNLNPVCTLGMPKSHSSHFPTSNIGLFSPIFLSYAWKKWNTRFSSVHDPLIISWRRAHTKGKEWSPFLGSKYHQTIFCSWFLLPKWRLHMLGIILQGYPRKKFREWFISLIVGFLLPHRTLGLLLVWGKRAHQ